MVRNSTMEPTFYEEQVGSTYGPTTNRMGNGGNVIGNMKRSNLTLDLKRPLLMPLAGINSPELMKLGTPEIERLLASPQDSMIMTMPMTTAIYSEKGVTEAQEEYVRGFVDALNELHQSDSSQEPSSIQGATYTNLEPPSSVQSTESMLSQGLVQIKDEPQTVPSVSSSPPMSPIDMESQEKIKLERKRQRNRLAASKCRRRKLERITRLEDKVKLLKGENSDLSQIVNRLRDHVSRLKEQVIDHMNSGCHIAAIPGGF